MIGQSGCRYDRGGDCDVDDVDGCLSVRPAVGGPVQKSVTAPPFQDCALQLMIIIIIFVFVGRRTTKSWPTSSSPNTKNGTPKRSKRRSARKNCQREVAVRSSHAVNALFSTWPQLMMVGQHIGTLLATECLPLI